MTLRQVLMTAVDGSCSNAYWILIHKLTALPPNKKYTVEQIIKAMKHCSDEWEKEINKSMG